jgi:O-antigen ligase
VRSERLIVVLGLGLGLGLGLTALVSLAIVYGPILAVAAIASLCALVGMVLSARVRFLVVFVGGLLVFQSDQGVGATKYVYLAAAILAVNLSLLRLARSREPVVMAFRPLLPASVGLLLFLGSSAFVAQGAGASMTDWFRDVLPYFLVVLLPVVGLDAAQDLSGKHAERLLAIAGFVAAIGFTFDWLDRRGVSTLGFGRVVLATTTLAALGFAYTITKAGLGPHRLRWLAASTAIMTMMLVNGTRTNIVLLVATVGVVGSRNKLHVPARRVVSMCLFIVAAAAVVLPVLASVLVDSPNFLQQRILGALSVITGQAGADQSFVARQQSYVVARDAFSQSPWFGIGPGHLYRSMGFDSMSLDTPWLVSAKLGVIGVAALVIYLLTVAVCVRRVRKLAGWSMMVTVGRGWGVVLLALVPFGPWIEDKGFALALTLYLTALAATAREAFGVNSAQHTRGYESGITARRSGSLLASPVQS